MVHAGLIAAGIRTGRYTSPHLTHLRERFAVLAIDGMPRRRVGVAQRRRGLPSAPAKAVIDVLGLVVTDSLAMPEGIYPTPGPA